MLLNKFHIQEQITNCKVDEIDATDSAAQADKKNKVPWKRKESCGGGEKKG